MRQRRLPLPVSSTAVRSWHCSVTFAEVNILIIRYQTAAFIGGFLLDLLLGDPMWLPHPVRLIGKLIEGTEKLLRGNKFIPASECNELQKKRELFKGVLLVLIVIFCTIFLAGGLLFLARCISPACEFLVEVIMTYQILAAKSLKTESMKVYHCLKSGDLPAAREAVSMIVGRDTAELSAEGVAKAAIETVAENTSDGVIAPMLYLFLGGPVLGFFYKAVNTMDSMVGYKNERYLYFGRAAAKLDDVLNFLPSRLSAWLMILAAFLSGKEFDGKHAYQIYRRDCRKHASPNSAQTESVCAGALGICLAGDARYFGKLVKKPFIGDALRPVEAEDIKRVNRLMYETAWICFLVCFTLRLNF